MADEKASVPFSVILKVVRNMEIAQDGKVLAMLGTLVVKDGLIVGMEHCGQINLEVIGTKPE